MNLIDDLWPRENYYFRSDHYNFARKGVPQLLRAMTGLTLFFEERLNVAPKINLDFGRRRQLLPVKALCRR